MKTLALALIASSLLPLAASAKNDLKIYDQAYKCEGMDLESGKKIKFKLEMADYDGRSYGVKTIKKLKLDGEKQDAIDLTKKTYKCPRGDKMPVIFGFSGTAFTLSVGCNMYPIEAQGTCVNKSGDLSEGAENDGVGSVDTSEE
ncbi:MAG: hypothetical protein EOP11_21750 [Proteobacteria bacterium]|nr:MAG: hypothetical protein EOP11_21750 [Pseudomonadota bacterium]